MKGVVKGINRNNGLVAVQLECGEFSIFEPLGGYDIDIGDVISGEIDFDGGNDARNISKDEDMDIMVEYSGLAHGQVREILSR